MFDCVQNEVVCVQNAENSVEIIVSKMIIQCSTLTVKMMKTPKLLIVKFLLETPVMG